jgi:hypothetical protein
MKLQKFYTLAAAAILMGAISAQAQTAALNATAGPFDNLKHDCVAKAETGSEVLLLNQGDVVVQSFNACAGGVVSKAYAIVKQSSNQGKIEMMIEDLRGNILARAKMTVREGFNGLVTSKLTAEVNKGERYNLKIRAISTDIVIEGRYNTDEKNDLYLNGWKLDGNISTAVGIQEVRSTTEALESNRNPYINDAIDARATEFGATFSVYPNPFVDQVSVTFKKDLKGETQIILMDLAGNMLHREVRLNPVVGQKVNITPTYNLNPGAYALRILNDNRVFNQTIMKH